MGEGPRGAAAQSPRICATGRWCTRWRRAWRRSAEVRLPCRYLLLRGRALIRQTCGRHTRCSLSRISCPSRAWYPPGCARIGASHVGEQPEDIVISSETGVESLMQSHTPYYFILDRICLVLYF